MTRIKPHLGRVAIAVLAIAVLGAGSATAASLVTSKTVKNRSLRGVDIKKGSLSANLLSAKARAALTGQQGPKGDAGQAGPQGPAGIQGPKGDRGPSDAIAVEKVQKHDVGLTEASKTIVSMTVAKGTYVFGASLSLMNDSANPGDFTCRIVEQINEFEETLAESTATLAADAWAPFGLTGASKVDLETTTVSLRCSGSGNADFADVTNAHLVATQVGALS